jgi:prevent-host-death family protein
MSKTRIPASEAKAKFSEILQRTRNGEAFAITLHGQEVANLTPANRPTQFEIQKAISEMEDLQKKTRLNPEGMPKLNLKDLIKQGRR